MNGWAYGCWLEKTLATALDHSDKPVIKRTRAVVSFLIKLNYESWEEYDEKCKIKDIISTNSSPNS